MKIFKGVTQGFTMYQQGEIDGLPLRAHPL